MCGRGRNGRHGGFRSHCPKKRGGSNPLARTNALLAQMEERLFCNQDVAGSIPAEGTKLLS